MVEQQAIRPSVTDAEAAVRNHPDIFRLLVDAVTDYGIFALDRDGYIQTWNAGAERLMGYPAEEIVNTHFSRFYTASDLSRQHPEFELRRAREDGRYHEEAWRLKKDGSRFWANVSIIRMCDREGRHIGFTKVTGDLTERKLADEKLRASEERMRLMIDSVQDYAIIMLDRHGTVKTWNGGARQITGFAADEIIGHGLATFYLPDEARTGRPVLDLRTAREYGRVEGEGWRVRKDGSRFWAQATLTPIFGDAGLLLGYSCVTRDLTERVRSESCVRRAQDDLERRIAERTAELARAVRARDELVSLASHELKTPLTSLKLAAQIRLRQIDRGQLDDLCPARLREMMTADEKQIRRLTRLVDDMLELSRLNLGKFGIRPEPCDLGDLLGGLVARLGDLHPESRIDLDPVPAANGPWDAFRLEQVLTNLITNAIRYGAGTRVGVRTEREATCAVVHVHDDGPGIAEPDQARIFQPFERAVSPNDASGLGLGLFISRQIAEAHGGSLTVTSQPGRGTTFSLRLPLGPA